MENYSKKYMFLRRILISNFKNIREADIVFSPKINAITGNNGEGKTNLLDAVYYLSMCKSYFNTSDTYTCTFGSDGFALNGTYLNEDSTEETIGVALKQGGAKTVRRNGKQYQRMSDHIGVIPIVMVSPSDTMLVNGAGEERRRFANALLSQVDREYLRRIQRYNQFLAQRNRLLKSAAVSGELLETISERMSPDAAYIYRRRKELCGQLQELMVSVYDKVSGGKDTVSLKYVSDLERRMEEGEGDGALLSLFEENAGKDAVLKYTSAGVQRDDIEFFINGHHVRRCASQGEQKSFLISLKLAQFSLVRRIHGMAPILLLDDLFDKLDMNRVQLLMRLVAGDGFGQIFITDSNKVRVGQIAEAVSSEVSFFKVSNGEIYEKE